jgi:hypothetical protein
MTPMIQPYWMTLRIVFGVSELEAQRIQIMHRIVESVDCLVLFTF